MCTAISYKTSGHFFGRTLDYFTSYGERIVITPRNYVLTFRQKESLICHYGIIGMAAVANTVEEKQEKDVMHKMSGDRPEVVAGAYPLYFDATNEKGLSMAGLNFPENADYKEPVEGKDNIAPFEFIPWILGQCENVAQAKVLLQNLNLVNLPYHKTLPLSPLHWMIADREESIVVEQGKDGLQVYENPVGILTNNPPFPLQMFQLNNYMQLSTETPKNNFSKKLPLHGYSYGMGAMGLPGDFSSMSRFVRGAFVKLHVVTGQEDTDDQKDLQKTAEKHMDEEEGISEFFHIMDTVAQPKGCVVAEKKDGVPRYEKTMYTSCCNTHTGVYYYTTYENRQISGVDMRKENLDGENLLVYPIRNRPQIYMEQEIGIE